MKYTIDDFRKDYPNNSTCLEAIFNKNYSDAEGYYRVRDRMCYSHKTTRHQIYPLAGTIFEKTSTPLVLWFHAIYLFSASKNGVSAKEIQRQLGVTYKCAWRMCHQIRKAMDENTVLKGTVEADETYVGGKGKNNKRGRGAENTTLVFGLVERKGAVMGRVVGNVKSSTVMPIVRSQVAIGTQVMTDEYPIYN